MRSEAGCGDDLVISTYSVYVSTGRYPRLPLPLPACLEHSAGSNVSTTPLMGAQRKTSYQITIVWENWIRTRAAVNDRFKHISSSSESSRRPRQAARNSSRDLFIPSPAFPEYRLAFLALH